MWIAEKIASNIEQVFCHLEYVLQNANEHARMHANEQTYQQATRKQKPREKIEDGEEAVGAAPPRQRARRRKRNKIQIATMKYI